MEEEEVETELLNSVGGLPPSDTFSSPPSLFFEPAHHDLILQFFNSISYLYKVSLLFVYVEAYSQQNVVRVQVA